MCVCATASFLYLSSSTGPLGTFVGSLADEWPRISRAAFFFEFTMAPGRRGAGGGGVVGSLRLQAEIVDMKSPGASQLNGFSLLVKCCDNTLKGRPIHHVRCVRARASLGLSSFSSHPKVKVEKKKQNTRQRRNCGLSHSCARMLIMHAATL